MTISIHSNSGKKMNKIKIKNSFHKNISQKNFTTTDHILITLQEKYQITITPTYVHVHLIHAHKPVDVPGSERVVIVNVQFLVSAQLFS